MTTVGLIGIGLMGTVVADRLIAAGYPIIGWDLSDDRRRCLHQAKGIVADGIAEVFAKSDRVLLSLPTHETVAEVLRTAQGVLRRGHVVIDMSTGDPTAATVQGNALTALDVDYLDATVSGSSEQLRKRQAVFLVGAAEAAFQNNRDLFDSLSEKVFHTGPVGSGARMKLVTNLVLGLNRAALAEGLCFARQLGLDLNQSLSLLRESMSYSRIMDTKGEKMIQRDFSPQARLSQHLKDVRLIITAAGHAELPLTETHRQLLEQAERMGLGDLDNSAIVDAIAARRHPAADQ